MSKCIIVLLMKECFLLGLQGLMCTFIKSPFVWRYSKLLTVCQSHSLLSWKYKSVSLIFSQRSGRSGESDLG